MFIEPMESMNCRGISLHVKTCYIAGESSVTKFPMRSNRHLDSMLSFYLMKQHSPSSIPLSSQSVHVTGVKWGWPILAAEKDGRVKLRKISRPFRFYGYRSVFFPWDDGHSFESWLFIVSLHVITWCVPCQVVPFGHFVARWIKSSTWIRYWLCERSAQ